MKKLALLIIAGTMALSCSTKPKEKIESELPTASEESVKPVPISIEKLSGVWKYTEVRTEALEAGIPQKADILLGISDDYHLAYSVGGQRELELVLNNLSTEFDIKDNQICAKDTTDITFKMDYGSNAVSVFLLNDKELVLEKGPVFRYFTRVK